MSDKWSEIHNFIVSRLIINLITPNCIAMDVPHTYLGADSQMERLPERGS